MIGNVSIVGAGTAGLIAAKALSRHGIRTTVYDQKHRLGRPPRASGILSIKGLGSLGIEYSRAVTNTLSGARIHAGGQTVSIKSKEPIAHVLDRPELNEICREEAESAGALVITGQRISGHALDRMSGSGILIGADGAVSSVAGHFSMGPIGRHALTYKAEYEVSSNDGMVDLFFDSAYKGLFAWLCPNSNDILEVGVGVDSRYGNGKRAFEHFIRSKDVAGIIGYSKPVSEGASMIPMSMRHRIVDESRGVLLVGDAAGQVKATTGGGIIFGGNAALIAAETIKRHMEEGASLKDYEDIFSRRYGMEMALHRAISAVYSNSGPGTIGLGLRMMRTIGLDRFLGDYGDMDMPSLMIKRFFLRGLSN
ncbi:MAG: NAD(P)/FAD-dependent oxidoreductase [Candidatus Micrarchaeota archaeon]|nr:NAD(P)/FAD-dependent oxidoreductase [Candidatus Micrarchaeota archaeon]